MIVLTYLGKIVLLWCIGGGILALGVARILGEREDEMEQMRQDVVDGIRGPGC